MLGYLFGELMLGSYIHHSGREVINLRPFTKYFSLTIGNVDLLLGRSECSLGELIRSFTSSTSRRQRHSSTEKTESLILEEDSCLKDTQTDSECI